MFWSKGMVECAPQSKKHITIDGREIGPEFPLYIIAELSANLNGDINRAY